jgi:hypothetical protein
LDVDFLGFFPGEACIADITINSAEPLTNVRIDGGDPALQIYLTDGPDYWTPTSSADLTGTGPYSWTGKVVVQAHGTGDSGGVRLNEIFYLSGDLTR